MLSSVFRLLQRRSSVIIPGMHLGHMRCEQRKASHCRLQSKLMRGENNMRNKSTCILVQAAVTECHWPPNCPLTVTQTHIAAAEREHLINDQNLNQRRPSHPPHRSVGSGAITFLPFRTASPRAPTMSPGQLESAHPWHHCVLLCTQQSSVQHAARTGFDTYSD